MKRVIMFSFLLGLSLFGLVVITPTSDLNGGVMDEPDMTLEQVSVAWTQPTPYQAGQWVEYWTNSTGGDGDYLLFKIIQDTNDTWWAVEVWNETDGTLNQTAYVKKISGENGHQHVYGVADYAVYSVFVTSHPTQWDRWFNLTGVSVGSLIGPIESEEGDNINLAVNATEYITTPAGTFQCWRANQSTIILGLEFRFNYWIDKESNITVQATTEIPAFNTIMIDRLTAASWLTPPNITDVSSDPLRFSATIRWVTDEPSNSIVSYGVNTSEINMTVLDASLVDEHIITLTSLQPLTTYYFEVNSSDEWGNQANDNNSGQFYSFTTLSAETPEISSIEADVTSNSTVTIKFDTDKETNATVWYSQSEEFTQGVVDVNFSTRHEIGITGLAENTEYLYFISVCDGLGNLANSTIRTFITLDQTAPVVISLNYTVVDDQLTVRVAANEPFRGELYISSLAESLYLADNASSYLTLHELHTTGLPSFTQIYFQLTLFDQSGNSRSILNGSEMYSVLIPDYLIPEVNHPDDIFVTQADILPNITWIINDQTPLSYEIRIDGISQGVKTWTETQSTVVVVLQDLNLSVGLHSIEIILRDQYGNTARDIVIVTVHPHMDQTQQEVTNDVIIVVIIILLAALNVVGLRRKRR